MPKEKAYHANTPLNGDMKMNGRLETNAKKNSRPRKTNQSLQAGSVFLKCGILIMVFVKSNDYARSACQRKFLARP